MSAVESADQQILNEALAQLEAGRLEEAQARFRQVLDKQPENVEALSGLGRAAYKGRHFDQAVDYLTRAVGKRDLAIEDHNTLGLAYLALDRKAEAQSCLRKALDLDPASPETLKNLGTVFAKEKDYDKASDFYRRAIAISPKFAEAYNNLGNILKFQGRPGKALEAYNQALKLKPDLSSAYQNMGALYAEEGKFEEAVEAFEKALNIAPKSPQVHLNLAKALSNQGQGDAATERYREAMALMPDDIEPVVQLANHLFVHNQTAEAVELLRDANERFPLDGKIHACLGFILQHQGEEDDAVFNARQAIEIDPHNHAFHNNLGSVLQRQGQREDALSHFRRAVELAPDAPEGHCHIGAVMVDEGKLDEAAEQFNKSIQVDPNYALAYTYLGSVNHKQNKTASALDLHKKAIEKDPGLAIAHSNLGAVLQETGQVTEALDCYDRALGLEPNLIEARTNRGIALQELGRLSEAEETYLGVLKDRPDFIPALRALTAVHTTKDGDEHAARMTAMLEDESLTHDERCDLHFALAKVHEDLGDYDKAFELAETANSMDKEVRQIDTSNLQAFCDRSIEVFSENFFATREGFGISTDQPIFIVGLPRAGTTLVEQILSSHPDVYGGGELPFLPELCRDMGKRFGYQANYPEVITQLDDEACRRLATGYLEKLRHGAGDVSRITDKMPFNFMRLGLAALLFPKARFIHCRRDPLDVYVSGHFLKFKSALWFFNSVPDFVSYYRIYRTLTEHWNRVLPVEILTVDYEDLVRDQETESRRLIDHCGLEWNDRCLDFHHNPRPVRTASNVQVRRPLYTYAIGHWQNYEKHLGSLKEALGAESHGA